MLRTKSLLAVLPVVGMLTMGAGSNAADAPAASFLTFSAKKTDVVVSRSGTDFLRFSLAAWGPNWAWTGRRCRRRPGQRIDRCVGQAPPVGVVKRADRCVK